MIFRIASAITPSYSELTVVLPPLRIAPAPPSVSVTTVERHLGDIYSRLGVRGRTALAAQRVIS